MKNLIRWTVGDVSQDGLDILQYSIRLFKKCYPDIDRVVCFNNIEKNKLCNLDADLLQQHHTEDMEYLPQREMWKMYPARMRPESHEIVIDNDLIIFRRFKEIDDFLNSDFTLMLRGRARKYGRYDHLVPQPHAINSGLYGMPPHFDLASKIKKACENDVDRAWIEWCDDQGVIAYSLFQNQHIIIEPETILNYFPEYDFPLNISLCGVHFQGANRNLRKNWRLLLKPFIL